MKINIVIIAIVVVAILAFVYFIIRRNRKDQKDLEKGLNEQEIAPQKHEDNHI